ncbi:transcription factor AIG1 [Elaeis guineensis]|uniref:Transcription factor bHLH51 n=1 Tax=Elaeis guineensis var. tenera TaxID=51953 RepID=A0A6I9R5M2_ELAGV|nr:transcription factor bHLH51 [Elaeis guineensis]
MAQCFPPYGWSQEGKKRSSFPKGSLLLPRPSNSAPPSLDFGASCPFSSSSVSGRSATAARALKIHSEAEKRRRERINAHLSTLRRMIPDADKMDKASLLGRVIDQVKDLKRKASDIGNCFQVPAEVNEVTVECNQGNGHPGADHGSLYIKATICCNDRPDLFTDLTQAFHDLRLRTIRADITSLGGRVQNVFMLYGKEGNVSVCLSSLKESIEEALSRVVSPDMAPTNVVPSKKQKLLESHYSRVTF